MEQVIQNMNNMMDRMEAIERMLNQDSVQKPAPAPTHVSESLVKNTKRTKVESIMPWTGCVNESLCSGLKVNHGLYTQCDNARVECKDFCKTCSSQCVKNGSDVPNSGTVKCRLGSSLMEYTDKRTGKKCVSWVTVLKRLNIPLEDAMKTAARLNIDIPEEQMIECEKKRGRPKKSSSIEDSSNPVEGGVGDESPKKRGRPKKSKKEVETVAGDDLIASLILNLNPESVVESGELEIEDVEEESTEVRKLTIDGVNYLVDEVNTVYDMESQDEIGTYDPETNSIIRDGL